VHPEVAAALAASGVRQPWTHQAQAAALAGSGQNVIIATRAASGKSAGYLAAALSAVLDGGTALYIAPTKALAADQLRVVRELGVPGVRAVRYDGDSTPAERAWAQAHANYLLTNPDMLHGSMLPSHARWRGFYRRLRVVIIDECHGYRGVFGSHVAQVLRRLRRIAAHYHPGGANGVSPLSNGAPPRQSGEGFPFTPLPGGTSANRPTEHPLGLPPAGARGPVFILASATIADPARSARLLTGLDFAEVTDDASPRAPLAFVLWEPQPPPGGATPRTPRPPRRRRPVTSEAADLLAGLVAADVPSLAFVRSRRGAEAVALSARGKASASTGEIAAYRSGYLADDRRALEEGLRDGGITGMATTTALEVGVSIPGLDAVLIAGWPGTWASLWQQAGRAGRSGRAATAVFIAGDDPLDTYLVRHPDALLRRSVEPAVLDPVNPYVLAPHLASAAAELPLTDADLELFAGSAGGPGDTVTPGTVTSDAVTPGTVASTVASTVTGLVEAGDLRRRESGWHWARRGHPARRINLRGDSAAPIRVVEESTGRLVGVIDEPSAHRLAHDGAVYLHQGDTYLVRLLDLPARAALVECQDPGYVTRARNITDIKVINELRNVSWGEARVAFGDVRVVNQVVSYATMRPEAAFSTFRAAQTPLSLPPRELTTRAFWWTIPDEFLLRHEVADIAGATHAAEHAAISLLPLFAACDQRDVAGACGTTRPAGTCVESGTTSVFIYDSCAGGAGFAERGYQVAADLLRAIAGAMAACPCEAGCPSCVHSARCSSGNSPLSKTGATALVAALLAASGK
jgi:DEAD/DEAH box helicase domain-containing protein